MIKNKDIKEEIEKVLRPIELKGVKLTRIKDNGVELTVDLNNDMTNYRGALHGGMSYSICDICSGITLLSKGYKVSTLQANINYIKEGLVGPIVAKSNILHKGRTTSVVDVKLYDGHNNLLVTGIYTMFILGYII